VPIVVLTVLHPLLSLANKTSIVKKQDVSTSRNS
jgi:hypothetical protein